MEGLAERRREEILAAATAVFAEKGIRATDVEEIAARVGVGKGTVYRYFPSKDELFLAAVARGLDRLRAAVDEAYEREGTPRARLEAMIEAFLAHFDDDPDLVEILVMERAEFRERGRLSFLEYRKAVHAEMADFDEDLRRARVLRFDPGGPGGDVATELLYGLILTSRYAGGGPTRARRRALVLDVLLHGILRPEAKR